MPVKIGNINASLNGIAKVIINGEIYYQLGSTYLRLIKDTTVSVATTSVTIDTDENSQAFSFGKDKTLMLVADINNTSVSGVNYYAYVNSNTTINVYYHQRLSADGTNVSSTRVNNAIISNIDPLDKGLCIVDFKLTNDGYFTSQSDNNKNYGTNDIQLYDYAQSSTFTATTITQLDIVASVTNAIGVGSRFMLFEVIN